MIVDLEKAKLQLDLVNSDNDDKVTMALDAAVAIVIDYLKLPAETYLDQSLGVYDMPTIVAQAVLLMTVSLFNEPAVDPLNNAVRSILHRQRDPAIA